MKINMWKYKFYLEDFEEFGNILLQIEAEVVFNKNYNLCNKQTVNKFLSMWRIYP